ncbi:MAG: DJ-1/PfpI family protein [Chitinophagaceae bacterium]
MKILKTLSFIAGLVLTGVVFLNACSPIRNLTTPPATWQGSMDFKTKPPAYDAGKKNVFVIADAKMTVLFDMLAPFYLFNATGRTNVYIVAKDKTPILIKRNLFVSPQLTFTEADSMNLQADVIVIPALSKRDENQDTVITGWIKAHFLASTKMLAICDGASTAAATGLYDGKPLTCHASDYAGLKVHFSKPEWIQNVAVTQSGNLFSTGGVSNAVEGSLTVINELFGEEIKRQVLANIHYPETTIKTIHKSIAVSGSNKFTVARKIFFSRNRKIGLLLENGMNEFEMASIIETYGRSFPASFATRNVSNSTIQTKYGLTLACTGDAGMKGLDELHLLMPETFSKENELYFKNTEIIRYNNLQKQYLINVCLERIGKQYGHRFEDFVKISLDYN